MNNSPLSMGWILAMFDLPVMTDQERKVATRFRNDLLENGFLMIQFSVYARPCVNFEQIDKHIAAIRKLVPEAGNVRLLYLTDQQWAKSITVIGENYKQGKRATKAKVPDQVEFW
jgi:CRISPR-associated protein Cas2